MTGSDAQLAFILNESIILTTTFDRFRWQLQHVRGVSRSAIGDL